MTKDSMGDRFKRMELVTEGWLQRRTPVVIRIDGKAFHSWTKGLEKPYDERLKIVMSTTLQALCDEIQNCVFGYSQSDEISLLLIDYKKLETEQWFDGNVQKIASVAASMATGFFNNYANIYLPLKRKVAFFDARVFNVPKEDVNNYFLWRQKDATRNSIQMYGQSLIKHKNMQGLNNSQIQEKLFSEHNLNWNHEPTWKKRGFAYKTDSDYGTDYEIPEFSKDHDYINDLVNLVHEA
jgi:tRNA(His) 5'-end guanylyltransferase